jgi:hypothetical protein
MESLWVVGPVFRTGGADIGGIAGESILVIRSAAAGSGSCWRRTGGVRGRQ